MTRDGRRPDANAGAARRRAALLEVLRAAAGRPLSVREAMQRARISPGDRTGAKRDLRDLAREGALLRDGKRFAVPAPPAPAPPRAPSRPAPSRPAPARRGPGVVGTLARHRDGYGFVSRLDRRGEDVFVPPEEAGKALDGDLVQVEIAPARGGRSAGTNLRLLERRRRWLLGTYLARGKKRLVLPADRDIEGAVPVPDTDLAGDGDLVVVEIDRGVGPLAGRVVQRAGAPGEPDVEVLKVAYARGFSDLFPDEVRAEAERVPDRVRPEDRRGRRDLTALPLVTIDGEDARDFDDAVYVERGAGRGDPWRLVVAIADVAAYVRPGGALDVEAARRGTSVYFPSRVLPMLPERLSNGICSLNPLVDRLCLVADLAIGDQGETRSAEIYAGVMRSAARCTYAEVARALAGERPRGPPHLAEGFARMADLQARLTAMRARRGAIDLDLPEAKIALDAGGFPVMVERRPRTRAHRIVEEFMLAANEAVARHFGRRRLPTIYRVHGTPDEEKLEAFRRLAAAHGFEVPAGPLTPRAMNALLRRLEGHPQQRALNQLLLRAMMQAVYSPENAGHFGLAAEHYLHFTSPIRRYPDLVVHRLLHEERERGGLAGRLPERDLGEIALLASERERAAMAAEREVSAFYAALFMRAHVGERVAGVVASAAEPGLFVELGPWFVEGLVRAEELGPGFAFDVGRHALVDRRSGRAYRVGDRVEVEVAAASPARRQIDLRLVEGGEVRRGEGERERGGPRGRKGERAPARRRAGSRRRV